MMHFAAITLFPEMFDSLTKQGVVGRAFTNLQAVLHQVNPRQFTSDIHQTVDDRPFGGGPGMVMTYQPLADAVHAIREQYPEFEQAKVVLLSPLGQRFDQALAEQQANEQTPIIFVCGRYEGVDQRFIDRFVDDQWSVGDMVLSGGELAAMTMMDAIIRLLPGVLGAGDSAVYDSFSSGRQGLLDCPHYTRPQEVDGLSVPKVLLSGNHSAIEAWREEQSMALTREWRPDLLPENKK